MTREEIANIIKSFGYRWTYYRFPKDKAPALPYVVYHFPDRNDYMADNENYRQIETLRIELYTESRDFQAEQNLEVLLPFPFSKDVEYINNEKMYQISYETEVLIHG